MSYGNRLRRVGAIGAMALAACFGSTAITDAATFEFTAAPGAPTFSAAVVSAVAAPLTKGGTLGLFVQVSDASSILYLPGNGAGGFGAPQTIPVSTGDFRFQVATDPVSGDTDIVVTSYVLSNGSYLPAAAQLYAGNGSGTFTPLASPTALPWAAPVQVGDVNGDGNLDLILGPSCSGGSGFEVLLGDGQGHFAATAPTAVQDQPGCQWESGDFYGHRRTDVAVEVGGATFAPEVATMAGQPNGTLAAPVLTTLPSNAGFIAGAANVATNGMTNVFFTALGQDTNGLGRLYDLTPDPIGDGGMQLSQTLMPFGRTLALYVGNFTGSGRADVLADASPTGGSALPPTGAQETLDFFADTGSGFGSITPLPVFPSVIATTGDFTGDGRTDLVVGQGTTTLTVYLDQAAPPTPVVPTTIAVSPRATRLKLQVSVTRVHRRNVAQLSGTLLAASSPALATSACQGHVVVDLTAPRVRTHEEALSLKGSCTFSASVRLSLLGRRYRQGHFAASFAGNTVAAATTKRISL